jgi:ABC-type Na+ efflux pump permease subunit
MKVLDIASKDLLRSFRSMFFWMFGLGVPLLMAGIFYFAFGGTGSDDGFDVAQVDVQVVNLDEPMPEYGNFSAGQMLVGLLQSEELAELLAVTEVTDPASARAAVDNQEADVAVIIPAGLSAAVFDPEGQAAVEVYQDPTLTLGPGIVKGIISQFVDTFAGSKIAAGVAYDQLSQQGVAVDPDLLQGIAMQYSDWATSWGGNQSTGTNAWLAIQSPLGKEGETTDRVTGVISLIVAGMMVFYAFFTGAASAMSILEEEEKGTLPRTFTTPTTQSAILGGKFIAIFALIVVQLVVLMTASSLIFGTDWGAPLPLVMVAAALVVLAASFGIFITSLLKDTRQTGVVYGGVMTVLGMLGISSVFTANVPNVSSVVDTLPLIVPQGWAMRALQLVMGGGGVDDALLPVVVMMALGIGFFLVGVFKFKKRFA